MELAPIPNKATVKPEIVACRQATRPEDELKLLWKMRKNTVDVFVDEKQMRIKKFI